MKSKDCALIRNRVFFFNFDSYLIEVIRFCTAFQLVIGKCYKILDFWLVTGKKKEFNGMWKCGGNLFESKEVH